MFCMLSAGSNVARIVCVNRNMKIATSSHIKRFFHYLFLCCCCCCFFCEGVAEEIFNSPQIVQGYFIIHRKASQRGRIFVFWWQQAWGRDGWILAEFFFSVFFVSVYKNARKQRGHINWTTLINRGLIIWQTDFAFIRIKNDSFLFVFRELEKNAICVCTTINPRVSSMFSFFWFSSAAFFHRRHCPKVTNFVSPLHALFPKRAREADSGINQNTAFASYCPRALPAK